MTAHRPDDSMDSIDINAGLSANTYLRGGQTAQVSLLSRDIETAHLYQLVQFSQTRQISQGRWSPASTIGAEP